MSWDEELNSIRVGTLFRFFGRVLVGVFFWYLILLIPLIIIALAVSC